MIDRTSTLRRFLFLKRCKVVILCPSRCPVPSSHDCLPNTKVKCKNKDKNLLRLEGEELLLDGPDLLDWFTEFFAN